MKIKSIILLSLLITSSSFAQNLISEIVYVESPTDTDSDGKPDLIYVQVERPTSETNLSSMFYISPYALGGNDGPMHNVDVDILPQDEAKFKSFFLNRKMSHGFKNLVINAPKYARVSAHSLGTGRSTGCATVGDMNETLAAKAVIDWLNGRTRGFDETGSEVKAGWSNGNVGMTGTSYDGTLPIMVATTGVEGLKAIIPVAAISNWYNYYRANGLVVNPGGYIGEDADVLGFFIMRKGACKTELQRITDTMGREHGDFTDFWQERDYLPLVKNIKAATFIIHGQSDWNVKQKHAIDLWNALEGVAPRRMFLHKGGHSSTSNHGVPAKTKAWFDHFLEGVDNGITDGPQVEVELPDGKLIVQNEWPHENTTEERLFFSTNSRLETSAVKEEGLSIIDSGKTQKIESLIQNPSDKNEGRLVFLSAPFERNTLLSGTSRVSLNFSVLNRKAANLTVAMVEYDKSGKGRIITRGWADAQNYNDIARGEVLVPGKNYQISFDIEPKQYQISPGNRLGVLIASTDYDYTLRPAVGTKIKINLGSQSYIDLRLSK